MNIFQLAGDMMHVISIIFLITSLVSSKNAVGISIKTQELYLIVFVCRYLDLFITFHSIYSSVMKVMYILSTAYVIFMVYKTEPYKTEYDKTQDSFQHWQLAVTPCAALALITLLNQGINNMEYWFLPPILQLMWTFSIYLEAICIVPQLIVLQRYQDVENPAANYVFFLGACRLLYILNWVYRAYHEVFYQHHWLVYASAAVQTGLYVDFFYNNFQSITMPRVMCRV